MKRTSLFGVLMIAALITITTIGCQPEDPVFGDLTVNIAGLEDLGPDYVYEGWLLVNASPVTTGTFTVDAAGDMSQSTFNVGYRDLQDATSYVLTIEPANDTDPDPSNVYLMSGGFTSGAATADLSVESSVGDFSNSTGKYILATPTDGPSSNEFAGVWFLDNSSGSAVAGLDLPALSEGWIYEGWAVQNGQPVSTGTFRSVDAADDGNPYSGPNAAPPFPGEDFLINPPTGVTFPMQMTGATTVISVEPVPDNSANPFLLKPLVGMVPSPSQSGVVYSMENNISSLPTGTASR